MKDLASPVHSVHNDCMPGDSEKCHLPWWQPFGSERPWQVSVLCSVQDSEGKEGQVGRTIICVLLLCPSSQSGIIFLLLFSPQEIKIMSSELILSSLGSISRTGEIYSQRHYWLTFQTKGLYEVHLYKHSLFMTSLHQVILGRGISVRLFTAGLFNSWTVTFRKKSKMKTFSVVACTQVLACGGHWGVGP